MSGSAERAARAASCQPGRRQELLPLPAMDETSPLRSPLQPPPDTYFSTAAVLPPAQAAASGSGFGARCSACPAPGAGVRVLCSASVSPPGSPGRERQPLLGPRSLNDFPEEPEFAEVMRRAEQAQELGIHPQRISQGSSGSYFIPEPVGVSPGEGNG